jgi:RimJ/RimL family protein N-acetyltransferase
VLICGDSGISTEIENVRVRVVSSGDREEIERLIDAVTEEEKHLQTSGYQATPTWECLFSEGISYQDGFVLLVAELGGRIVGFARLISGLCGPKDRHVGNVGIVVQKGHRGRGIGSTLLGELLRQAPNLDCSKLTAEIVASNVRSRSLFEKFGFQVEGIRHRQFRIGDEYVDEILMSTWLPTER